MSKAKRRIPKQVGGIKIPKELRRKGEQLLDKVDTPAGREMLATGIGLAATAAAAAIAKKSARRAEAVTTPAAPKPGDPGIDPRHDLGEAIAGVAAALQGMLKKA